MGPRAVTTRLREMSRHYETRGFIAKGVEMSVPAVTARLRTLAGLSDMCRRLAIVGRGLPTAARDENSNETGHG